MFHRILVLKDGQIVEQGSHAQLLNQNGIFATMWADQISVTEGETHFYGKVENHDGQVEEAKPQLEDKTAVSGYQIESESPRPEDGEASTDDAQPTQDVPSSEHESEAPAHETPSAEAQADRVAPAAFPSASDAPVVFPSSPSTPAVAFPSAEHAPEVPSKDIPVAFPSSDSAEQMALTDSPAPTVASPGITFSGDSHPEHGSADPDSEPKRKRISSQNFQRLARRISTSARRTGSVTGIPNLAGLLRRDSSTPNKETTEDGVLIGAELSTSPRAGSTDSPAPSVQTETTTPEGTPSKLKKKDKKEKRKTLK
jgi:hypothetical protein